jgi:hypothetical protein
MAREAQLPLPQEQQQLRQRLAMRRAHVLQQQM